MIIDTDNLEDVPTASLDTALSAISVEKSRRDAVENSLSRIEGLIEAYQSATGIHQEPGVEWTPPTSYLDSYPKNFEVTYNNKTWISLRNGAMGVPGEAPEDWQEVQVPEG